MSDGGSGEAQCTGSNLSFEIPLAVVSTGVWWVILLGSSVYAFLNRRTRSRGWNLYKAILVVIQLYALSSCWYALWIASLGSNREVKAHLHKAQIYYEVYIFWNNLTTAGFLGLLLLCSAGYCITRSDLGEHASRVMFIPVVLLLCGLVSDYIWFNYQKYPQEWCPDQYQIQQMDPLASAVWFLTAVMKLGSLLLSWIYIFDILTIETRALEATYKRHLEPSDAAAVVGASAGGANGPQLSDIAVMDLEGGEDGLQTVFDHVAYNSKRKLMSRFALTVSLYLITAVCVLLTPVVDTKWVQYTITSLNEVLKWVIVAVLAVIFRPVASNPYLLLGDPATGDLTTELGMLDGDDEDSDLSRHSPGRQSHRASKASTNSLREGDVSRTRDQLPMSTSASQSNMPGGIAGQFSLVDDEELEEIKLMERNKLSSQMPR